MKSFIILLIVFIIILITALIVYPMRYASTYEELGTWSSLKELFSGGKKSSPQALAEDFLQTYLKSEFHLPSLDLTLGESKIVKDWETGKFYGFGWDGDRERFYIHLSYNTGDEKISLIRFLIYSIGDSKDLPAGYYLLPSNIDWDCSETDYRRTCSATWFDKEGNKIEFQTASTSEGYTIFVAACKIYKESEVFYKGCFDKV